MPIVEMPPIEGEYFEEDPARWERVAELFEELLESSNPEAILAREPDSRIREMALALVAHHGEAGTEGFLPGPVDVQFSSAFEEGQVMGENGRFVIERRLGAGGMGEVYLATDTVLKEKVAVKTVAPLLQYSESIRRRFIDEVRNARNVTHANVCRINELYPAWNPPFFVMEYLQGETLEERLERGPIPPKEARRIIREIAEGLTAAHKKNVIHGDLKPSNVMLTSGPGSRAVLMDFGLARAFDESPSSTAIHHSLSVEGGTFQFMAPELQAGAEPDVRTDIYAFGILAQKVLPGERLLTACASPHRAARPEDLGAVIEWLTPGRTRRQMIGAASIVAATAGLAWSLRQRGSPVLPNGARLMVNGFRTLPTLASTARFARSLFLTGLQQSPKLRALPDQDLLPALRRLNQSSTLPVEGDLLKKLLGELRAPYWVDARFEERSGRPSLFLSLFRSLDDRILVEESFRDVPTLEELAKEAATWLREQCGESRESLAANPVRPLSPVPEALQKYYEAMDSYSVGSMAQAVPMLEEAVRLDGRFAQAWSILGMCHASLRHNERSFEALDKAKQLSPGLAERERNWIEANYYSVVDDLDRTVEAARKNVAAYPEEPRFYRVLAQSLGRAGYPRESVPLLEKGVGLNPRNELLWTDWIVALCESNRFQEGLEVYRKARAQGNLNSYVERGAGLAYMGLEDYGAARRAFDQMGSIGGPFLHAPKVLAGDFASAEAGLQQFLAESRAAGTAPDEHQALEYLCGIAFVQGRPPVAQVYADQMTAMPLYPSFLRQYWTSTFWAHRLKNDAMAGELESRLAAIEKRWSHPHTRAALGYARSVRARLQGRLDEAETLLHPAYGASRSVWPLFDLADLYTATRKFELADEYWQRWEEVRGVVLRRYFPGVLPLGWLARAEVARNRKNAPAAQRYAQRVIKTWAQRQPQLPVVRSAQRI